jgi:hypothetical protein
MAFKATFWNNSTNAIFGNGTQLSISDYSNYWGDYTDQCTGGSANTVILPTSASPYNDKYKNLECMIVAGTGVGQTGLCTGYVGSTRVATIATTFSPTPDATSVVQIGERGHLQSYFADFRKIYVNAPSEVWLISSLYDGNQVTIVPAGNSLPLTDIYIYHDGDEVYNCKLYTIPTWNSNTAYLVINKVNVYWNSKMWKLLRNNTGSVPGTDATIWEEVLDVTGLFDRYIANGNCAVTCDIEACKLNKLIAANNMCNPYNAELQLRSLDVQKAIQISLTIAAIPGLATAEYWTDADNKNANVRTQILFARQICCCKPC